ncbi:hypothetical protein FB451DRAFT_1162004 [Mycena latifolia]|nr:hypothetical protein FB451DRAFT_1162004 [Mycena latifolia]
MHEEDNPALPGQKKTQIIICLSPDNSQRLQKTGAYIQSDIGFKHIVGFDEFKLAAMDRDANTNHYRGSTVVKPKMCTVLEPVHEMMRSLTCVSYPNWDKTTEKIKTEGDKTAQGDSLATSCCRFFLVLTRMQPIDWICDKESCKFAFAGLCWEKSFIPLAIWQAGEAHSN